MGDGFYTASDLESDVYGSDPDWGGDVDTGGMISSYDDLMVDYDKDPDVVSSSEIDYFASIADIVKAGSSVYAQVAKPPASVNEWQQRLFPPATQGASAPVPMQKTMNPMIKAGLIVGGIVLGVLVIALGAKLVRG